MNVPALAAWETRFRAVALGGAGDAAHDAGHVIRVVASARALAHREGADPAVVLPAAYLHDCVAVPKHSPDRSRASRLSADRAEEHLRAWGYPGEHLPAIRHCIEAHSFSAGIPPRTIEAKVVQDADRLDALGAIGLARCLALGGELGRPLYALDDPFCERRPPNDQAFTLDHFFAKLLRLPGTMQTPSGRREAEARAEVLRAFLAQLRREIEPEGREPYSASQRVQSS